MNSHDNSNSQKKSNKDGGSKLEHETSYAALCAVDVTCGILDRLADRFISRLEKYCEDRHADLARKLELLEQSKFPGDEPWNDAWEVAAPSPQNNIHSTMNAIRSSLAEDVLKEFLIDSEDGDSKALNYLLLFIPKLKELDHQNETTSLKTGDAIIAETSEVREGGGIEENAAQSRISETHQTSGGVGGASGNFEQSKDDPGAIWSLCSKLAMSPALARRALRFESSITSAKSNSSIPGNVPVAQPSARNLFARFTRDTPAPCFGGGHSLAGIASHPQMSGQQHPLSMKLCSQSPAFVATPYKQLPNPQAPVITLERDSILADSETHKESPPSLFDHHNAQHDTTENDDAMEGEEEDSVIMDDGEGEVEEEVSETDSAAMEDDEEEEGNKKPGRTSQESLSSEYEESDADVSGNESGDDHHPSETVTGAAAEPKAKQTMPETKDKSTGKSLEGNEPVENDPDEDEDEAVEDEAYEEESMEENEMPTESDMSEAEETRPPPPLAPGVASTRPAPADLEQYEDTSGCYVRISGQDPELASESEEADHRLNPKSAPITFLPASQSPPRTVNNTPIPQNVTTAHLAGGHPAGLTPTSSSSVVKSIYEKLRNLTSSSRPAPIIVPASQTDSQPANSQGDISKKNSPLLPKDVNMTTSIANGATTPAASTTSDPTIVESATQRRMHREKKAIGLKNPIDSALFSDEEEIYDPEFRRLRPSRTASWCQSGDDWRHLVNAQRDIDPLSIFGCGTRPVSFKDVFSTPDFRGLMTGGGGGGGSSTANKKGVSKLQREAKWAEDQIQYGFRAGEKVISVDSIMRYKVSEKKLKDVSALVFDDATWSECNSQCSHNSFISQPWFR